jgi:hypothetical protein
MASDRAHPIECAFCGKVFHITFGANPRGKEPREAPTGWVAKQCLYCEREVMVEVPREEIPNRMTLRSLPRDPG